MSRLQQGGALIDRATTIDVRFNGRRLRAHAGDTLASALLANDVRVVARSFKYHRPRGIVALGDDEPNALVQLEPGGPYSEPNCRATCVTVYDGLSAVSQNCWPSVDFDVGALAWPVHRFLPSGFYYKTFKWPRWETFEPFIRRAAGLGRAPSARDPSVYLKRHAHCDVLVVGGGPAGLAAALAAAEAGRRVIVAHARARFGGAATGWPGAMLDGVPAAQWVQAAVERLRGCPEVTLLADTTVLGRYDHGMAVAVERLDTGSRPDATADRPRQRVWHIRAARTVLATGAHERPLVFPDNDRPGVMLSSAVAGYAHRYGVAAGRRVVFATADDRAYATALSLLQAGVEVAAVLDVRAHAAPGAAADALRERGVALHAGACPRAVRGARGVQALRFATSDSPRDRWIDCDVIAMSGGWTPAVQLFAQSNGALRFDDQARTFVPTSGTDDAVCVGAAAGQFDAQRALVEARSAGSAPSVGSATSAGGTASAGGSAPASASESHAAPRVAPSASSGDAGAAAASPRAAGSSWWISSEPADRQWVDLQSDVTAADVLLAAHERFVSVEHLKRYTTIGMATDQGKTSNVNALAILGEATARTPAQVGTTRFRPPYVPVTLSAIAAGQSGDLFAPRRRMPADAAHRAAGAVFEDFGGWQRPDHYPRGAESREQAVCREQLLVRSAVGLFDASPIGKIEVNGADAARLLDFIYANRIDNLRPGRIRYGLMLNENGAVFDDGVCARISEHAFLLSPTSSGAARVAAWLEEWRQCEFAGWDVNLIDVTEAWASIAVSGPASRALLGRLRTDIDLSREAFPHMSLREGLLEGVACRILRVSFSGELQFEVQVPAEYGESLWQRLLEAGRDLGAGAVGVEAWLRLRIEKGYVHVGADTDGTTLPADIGFGPAIERKPGDFAGRRSLLRSDALRADREQLVGLQIVDGDVARSPPSAASESLPGHAPLPVGASLIPSGTRPGAGARREGRVTSSCYSPSLRKAVALGMVCAGRSRHGERLDAWCDGRAIAVQIVDPVFYDREGARLDE